MLPFELTKDTPYLALTGELWSVFYEYFNRNWSCYKGFLLYQHWFDNDLVPGRWQPIIWTNASLVYWRIYASLDDLGRVGRVKFLIELYLYIRELPEPFVL